MYCALHDYTIIIAIIIIIIIVIVVVIIIHFIIIINIIIIVTSGAWIYLVKLILWLDTDLAWNIKTYSIAFPLVHNQGRGKINTIYTVTYSNFSRYFFVPNVYISIHVCGIAPHFFLLTSPRIKPLWIDLLLKQSSGYILPLYVLFNKKR